MQFLTITASADGPQAAQKPKAKNDPRKLEIAGRVLDQQGRAIANADVGLMIVENLNNQFEQNHPFVVTANSGADGKFRLKIPDESKKAWGTIWAHAPGYGPSRLTSTGALIGSLDRSDPELRLDAAKSTTISVRNADDQPMADALVTVTQVSIRDGATWPIPVDWADRFRVRTDKEGMAFVASFNPAALAHLRIDAAPSGRIEFDTTFFLNNLPAAVQPHFRLRLPEGGSIEGHIRAENAGARLWWPVTLRTQLPFIDPEHAGIWGVAEVRADQEGRFTVDRLAEGNLSAEIPLPLEKDMRANIPTDVQVTRDEATKFNIDLLRGVTVRGLIRKQDTGGGYPNYRLSVIYGQSAKTHRDMRDDIPVTTDEEGRFTAVVPPGPIELRLISAPRDYHPVEWWDRRARGGVWGSRRDVPADVTEFDLDPIDLVPAVQVTGKLIDKQGKPLMNWMVFGYPKVGDGEEVEPDLDFVMNSFAGVRTDEKGRFAGHVPKTHMPVYWKVTWRAPNQLNGEDISFRPKVVSKDPLVLQLEVDPPQPRDAE